MADAFVGQIGVFGFDFPPKNWALCNGQILPISQNQALFSLLGTRFGGDGTTTFGLPNLQTRVPMHRDLSAPVGASGGEAFHRLAVSELPAHTHAVLGTGATGVTASPSPSSRLGVSSPDNLYGPPVNLAPMATQAIGATAGSQPHENRQPFLTVNFCIALRGAFPPRP